MDLPCINKTLSIYLLNNQPFEKSYCLLDSKTTITSLYMFAAMMIKLRTS